MFIITAEPKERFDCNGKSLGLDEKRALYYNPSIGRRRVARQLYLGPSNQGLKLLSYKLRKNAQEVCDLTNEVWNDNFKVEEIN